MNSPNVMIRKLQKAINSRGEKLLYQQSQFYSEDKQEAITIHSIRKAYWDDDAGRTKSVELFKSASPLQIVLFLRDYWYEINGWEIPHDNPQWEQAKERYYSKQQKEEVV